jgi:hypothetical protein
MVTRGIRVARRPRIGIAVIAVAVALALAVVVLEARSLGAPSGAGAATRPAVPAETAWPISSSGIDHPGAYRGGHYVGPMVGSGIDHPGVYRGGQVVVGAEPTARIGHRPVDQGAPGK